MAMQAGTRLGAYEILSVLGAGGMGEVYRARDTRLGREVAIKVVLDAFAADADRVARLQREAKVLASLNHPHIAALYGLEESGGQHFLVMELVEGQTLADRLLRGTMPVEETLAIAVQIADALEAAHEKGVVHRDLKPANVKVTPDDKVKVLDFGLAKAVETDATMSNAANSPTLSMMASQAGVILGTAAYMSPEQAKGFPVDHRSDVFSFGSVLFEMLSGRQPFPGDTAPEVLASVLVREPEFTQLPPNLNARLADLLRRCLEKHPKRRWQAIGDVRAELEAIAVAAVTPPLRADAGWGRRPLWRRTMPAVISALVVGGGAAAAAWMMKPAPATPVVRFSFALPKTDSTSAGRRAVTISADGSMIAYIAAQRLNLRPIRDFDSSPLPGADGEARVSSPAFSPDGRSLAFYSIQDAMIKRIALSGGAPAPLCPAFNPTSLSWGADGIVFPNANPDSRSIMRVSANGGKPQVLLTLQPNEYASGPQILPDGDTLLVSLGSGARVGADRWDHAQIVAYSLKSGTRKTLIEGSEPRYLSTGHLAYAIGGGVYAIAFDARTLTLSGESFPVIEGVHRAPPGVSGMADYIVSSNGTLVYVPGPMTMSGDVALVLADQKGAVTPLKLPPGPYSDARVTRDGNRVVVTSTDGRDSFIAVVDVEGGSLLRRITYGGNATAPVLSPDGTRIAFQSARDGDMSIFTQGLDATGPAVRLTRAPPGEAHLPHSWSRGNVLLYDVVKGRDVHLWQLSLENGKSEPFGDVHSTVETDATFSPDGHWVAYSTTDEQKTSLFVSPFPASGTPYTLLLGRGAQAHHPIWSPEGDALFYTPLQGVLERVGITTAPLFSFGNPEVVPRPFAGGPPESRRAYDMDTRDGRILGIVTPGQVSSQINVVLNWFEELKARAPR